MTDELFQRALGCAPAIRRALKALESARRSHCPEALQKAASLLREAAGAAEDAADALELLVECARAREAEWRA